MRRRSRRFSLWHATVAASAGIGYPDRLCPLADCALNSPYTPPAASFPPPPPSERAIRLRGAVVFAALPLLLLVLSQSIMLVDIERVPTSYLFKPTLILAPAVALTGACGWWFALQCARSTKTGIVLLGIGIGVLWGVGADIAGTLIVDGMEAFARRPPAKLLWQTARVSAFITPIALINCLLVRHYGRRGANTVPGVKP